MLLAPALSGGSRAHGWYIWPSLCPKAKRWKRDSQSGHPPTTPVSPRLPAARQARLAVTVWGDLHAQPIAFCAISSQPSVAA